MKSRREAWPAVVAGVPPEDLAFLDETATTTKMGRTHGYAPRGGRVAAAVPHGHWKTVTFVAALTAGGLVAPLALDGPMTGAVSPAYAERILLPAVRPGTVVVLDNLPCHKVAGVREAVEAAGCRLEYRPPYSPDLNPIENAFGKLKGLLRTAAARTIDALYDAMRDAVTRFGPAECLNYLRHAGYAPATPTRPPL